eukprot:m.83169 g.83169  ORF g.83169 m.83169 type:complete len:57 (+) comp12114_c0_seq1:1629-1799(+)
MVEDLLHHHNITLIVLVLQDEDNPLPPLKQVRNSDVELFIITVLVYLIFSYFCAQL